MAHETPKNRLSPLSLGLSALTGLLIVFSLAPHNHWWMAWFSLVPWLYALRNTTLKQAALCGMVAGAVTNYGAFHWLTSLMNDFSNLGPGVYLVMALMALYQGVPYMLWAMFLRSALPGPVTTRRTLFAAFLTALAFPVFEFFYPIVFPWYLANTQHTRPDLTGVIELAGTGLLSLAIVVVNLCLARVLLPREPSDEGKLWPLKMGANYRVLLVGMAVLTFGFCWGFSTVRNRQLQTLTEQAEKLHLGLVQPNHWINTVRPLEAMHHYQRLTYGLVQEQLEKGRPLDLILWPESAVRTPIPRFTAENTQQGIEPQRYPRDLKTVEPGLIPPAADLMADRVPSSELWAVQRGHNVPMLFGTTMEDTDPDAVGALPGGPALYNCGVLIDELGAVVGVAPKVKLLLFGETIPLAGVFPFVYRLLPMASALVPGDGPVVIEHRRAKLGMMICYEDLLPWFHFDLARQNPDVLLNLTTDAWFGRTPEAECHLSLAKFRSVEGRVFLVRSTPTGVSCVVDATGAVVAELGMDQEGTLTYPVALLQVKTGWERFGDSVVWAGLFLVLGFLVYRSRVSTQ